METNKIFIEAALAATILAFFLFPWQQKEQTPIENFLFFFFFLGRRLQPFMLGMAKFTFACTSEKRLTGYAYTLAGIVGMKIRLFITFLDLGIYILSS